MPVRPCTSLFLCARVNFLLLCASVCLCVRVQWHILLPHRTSGQRTFAIIRYQCIYVYQYVQACWEQDEGRRPPFRQIVKLLGGEGISLTLNPGNTPT